MPTARNYRVIDQFPKAIQARQRKFEPYLLQARKDDKKASCSDDAIYVDRVEYTHDHPSPGPVPEMPHHGPLGTLRRDT
ncbi:hypothetical protein DPMN_092924 [Dreissena polymorpha]|uniref:Uncharacterized protein n=1 Tax=Dreissena polymorpha TaxID=45954 RepID=A0A9D4L4L1_DREPO|nr:hypothetical protein DPMN_092924 [Dreissena polymorpha]